MRRIPRRLAAALFVCATTSVVEIAEADPCTGTTPTELVSGCSVLTTNPDFRMRVIPPPGRHLHTLENARNTLNSAIVFVHGYNVTSTALPEIRFEDGREGVVPYLHQFGISVVSMAPGRAASDRVEDDARALRRALELVRGYRGPSAFPLVVFGHSMGGLLARIALADMEKDGAPHGVELYVSYDSPHTGVNVPQGMQYLKVKVDEWAAMTEADFVAIDPGWEGVFNLASLVGITTTLDPSSLSGIPDPTTLQAQQMTVQGVTAPTEYPAFMELLRQTGFPSLRKIAVTNGNTQGVGCTQEVMPGGELFSFSGAKGNSAASVRGEFQVFTDKPGATNLLSHVYYDGFVRNHDGGRKNTSTRTDIVLMDHLSGGTLDYAGQMLAKAEATRRDFHEPSYRGAANSAIPFVPVTSALALPLSTPDGDIAGLVAGGQTPFDRVFATGDLAAFPKNVDHNTLVMQDALLDEITAIVSCMQKPISELGDVDDDGIANPCDDDDDGDGILDVADNCPLAADPLQVDSDHDMIGDVCDDDDDGDGIPDVADNCPFVGNPDQADADADGLGDVCDEPEPQARPFGCAGCFLSRSAPGPDFFLWMLGLLALRRRRRSY